MTDDRTGRSSIRPKRRRWTIIGCGLLALVLLFGARDCYRFDDFAYTRAYFPAGGGEAEVSLIGSLRGSSTALASPYLLLIRYLTPDSTFERAELVSFVIRDAAGGDPMELKADSAAYLHRVQPGNHYWKSMDAPVADQNFAFMFRFMDIPLEYRDQVVSGQLRLIGSGGVREVPFTATLRTAHEQELRSRLWDRLMLMSI